MSSRKLPTFLRVLWLFGFLQVDQPVYQNGTDVTRKVVERTLRILNAVWSLTLMVYPALVFLDICLHSPVLPTAGSDHLSALIPWYFCLASQFVINAIIRLFSILNSSKLVQLAEMLRPLRTESNRNIQYWKKWYFHHLVWFVYAGQVVGEVHKLVHELFITDEYDLQGLQLVFVPQPRLLHIFITRFVATAINLCPLFPFHFIVTFGSDLVQVHGSICADMCEFLAKKPTKNGVLRIYKVEPAEPDAPFQLDLLYERFNGLKECFKIFEELAEAITFFIFWWSFVVVVTFCSSVTSNGLSRVNVINYGVWSVAFIYVVASFGDYMASRIEDGREAISDALGRLENLSALKYERIAPMVMLFH